MASSETLPDARPWGLPADTTLPDCPFDLIGAHDFDAHTVDGIVMQQNCRRCGLILPFPIEATVPTSQSPVQQTCPSCAGVLYVWSPDAFLSKSNPGWDD